jgi:hypothetical protein
MRIDYLGHASLAIRTKDARLVTDPWFAGPAYCRQWYVFPKPVDTSAVPQADFILFSHGHEDHLHPDSLVQVPRETPIYFPHNWYAGIKGYFDYLGFSNLVESPTFKTQRLRPDTEVTYVANNLDSLIVVESGGRVLVDANDALHAHHPNVIDAFTANIRKRWPKIDYLFCGFGGASYFPNCVHAPNKDDAAVGALREQLFAHNFCRIVHGLQPRIAVPFAADFALLEPHKRWINATRFPREKIAAYYDLTFGGDSASPKPEITAMYPGDVLDDGNLVPSSPYRSQLRDGSLDHLIDEQYAGEIAAKREVKLLDEVDADKLTEEIAGNVRDRAGLFSPDRLRTLRFSIEATDVGERPYYDVSFVSGEPRVCRAMSPAGDTQVVVRLSSEILRYSFASTWGGDAITIGYAADIDLLDESAAAEGLDSVCIRLLTRHPTASRYMMRHPMRAGKFLWQNPLTRSWAVRRVLSPNSQAAVYDPQLWLKRTKCEVCRVCDLPMLDDDFASRL